MKTKRLSLLSESETAFLIIPVTIPGLDGQGCEAWVESVRGVASGLWGVELEGSCEQERRYWQRTLVSERTFASAFPSV
eukprot:3769812-Rhodomonas_salina.3